MKLLLERGEGLILLAASNLELAIFFNDRTELFLKVLCFLAVFACILFNPAFQLSVSFFGLLAENENLLMELLELGEVLQVDLSVRL